MFVDTVIVKTDTVKELRKKQPDPPRISYTIQIGAFKNKEYAESFKEKAFYNLKTDVNIKTVSGIYKITAGKFSDIYQADSFLQEVKNKGYPDAFIKTE